MSLAAIIDARARRHLRIRENVDIIEVKPTVWHRIQAEWALRRITTAGDTVLCFHSQPPLFRSGARTMVFVQNREYISTGTLRGYRRSTRFRLYVERFISRALRYRATEYIVQTPSMRRALAKWHGGEPVVRVMPFIDDWGEVGARDANPCWDFVYVSDGEAHKNHYTLLEAWRFLADEGIRPSLAVTLGARDSALVSEIASWRERFGLRIENVGQLPRAEVLELYRSAGALIFPSILESFGLPLVEAARLRTPILAPELDYVRDVCTPAETFDASSAISVSRAVKRFLRLEDHPVQPQSAEDFLRQLLQ